MGRKGGQLLFLSLVFFSPLEIEYYGASELEQLDMGHRVTWKIFLRGTGIPTKDGSWVHGTVRICLQDWSGQVWRNLGLQTNGLERVDSNFGGF